MNNPQRLTCAFALACLFVTSAGHAQYRYTGVGGTIADAIQNGMMGAPDIPVSTSYTLMPAGFPGQITAARVSLYLVHPADQELGISLISPEGTVVPLVVNRKDSAGNIHPGIGATGANFGTGCADSARTEFEDGAANQIPTSTAPYAGVFIPVYPYELAALDGKFAGQVTGTWHLQVTDYRHGNAGVLACFTLLLDSTDTIFFDGFE